MNQLFALALGISSPWYIEGVAFSAEKKELDIKINFKKGSLFPYINDDKSEELYTAYDTVEKSWRHLNFFEHECILTARVPRVKNKDGNVQTYKPDWSGLSNGFTLLFEAIILKLAEAMPIHNICKMLHVSDKKIWNVLDKYVDYNQVLTHLEQKLY